MGLNIAQVLCGRKRFEEAASICGRLEPFFPRNANLAYAQGVIAKGTGQLDRAMELFDQALAWNPEYPICLNTYGLLLREIGRTNHARQCFEQALKHDPSFGAAMNNLGSVLKDVARYDESLLWLRKGAEALRDNPAAHSNVLFTLVGYELEPAQQRLKEAQRFATLRPTPFRAMARPYSGPGSSAPLKVGLISPDFCRHAVSYFVEPLLEQWDRTELEVCLYSCGEQIDDYSCGCRKRPTTGLTCGTKRRSMPSADPARRNRHLGGFGWAYCRQPACIAGGQSGTNSGHLFRLLRHYRLSQVDYWITDPVLHPPNRDAYDPCTETRWRLDRCYVSYRPLPKAPAVQPPPCERKGYITFGSFNQTRKITPQTANHWMEVLRAVPDSRLLLKSKNLGRR